MDIKVDVVGLVLATVLLVVVVVIFLHAKVAAAVVRVSVVCRRTTPPAGTSQASLRLPRLVLLFRVVVVSVQGTTGDVMILVGQIVTAAP